MDNFNAGSFVGDIVNVPFNIAALRNSRADREYQRGQDQLNRQMQYDFAQNSIKWRVADAKQAGIHPLAALGISPSSAQPVYSSASSDGVSNAYGEMARSFGQALSNLQLENLAAQVDKTKAETQAIQSQTGLSPDVSKAASLGINTTSAKKNQSYVVGQSNSGQMHFKIDKDAYDGSVTIFPVGINRKNFDEFAKEFATDGSLNLGGKISQWSQLPEAIKRKYRVDFIDSAGMSIKLIPKGRNNKFGVEVNNLTKMDRALLDLNLWLDEKIPFMKHLWRK